MKPATIARRTVVLLAAGLSAAVFMHPSARAQAPVSAPGQCSLTWVGHEAEIEAFLRTARIETLEQVPVGVTKPLQAIFEPGGLVARATWKPLPPSYRSGYRESYKAEIAAYLLDRLLDMHMVPPVVERRLDRDPGAIVFWIENTHQWNAKKPPAGPGLEWLRQVSRMQMFDQFIANIDRNAGNLLYDDDWHLFLIDHSRAFTDRKDLSRTATPTRIERAFWDRLLALDIDRLRMALGDWLSPSELSALLVRRDKMREAIGKMVAKRGEVSVFF